MRRRPILLPWRALVVVAPVLACVAVHGTRAETPGPSAEEILSGFVEDFRSDPFASVPVRFGVRVVGDGGGEWHVDCAGKRPGDAQATVTLRQGFPADGVVYFEMDLATLRRIDRGEIAELTAAGKARSSEKAPVEVDPTPGFNPGDAFWRRWSPLRFHFWTRSTPEVVRFGTEQARKIHGANAVLFYYERGIRTGWMQVEPGEHVNADPKDQINDFSSIFIITRGQCESRVGGQKRTLREGDMVFVPEGISHEFWNEGDVACEWVDIMFGGNA